MTLSLDSVLARQGDSPIKNFTLKCITGVHQDVVKRWIRIVLQRGVSDLNLSTDFSLDDVTVSSASLRKLTIHGGTGCEEFVNPKSISFDTPNVFYLNYSGLVADDYPVVKMRSLFVARINLMLSEDHIERIRAPDDVLLENGEVFVLRFVNVLSLMYGIRNVQILTLLGDTLEVLSLSCESLPVFKNLKTFIITINKDRGWQAMPVILRNCPRLETIIFKGLLHHVTDKCGDACPCISQEDKGHSLTSCAVKTIEIQGFRATMKEITMIKHLLDYFPCLEEMKVFIEEDDPTQLKNPEVSRLVLEMFELYNISSSCDVQLLVSDSLDKKWAAQGHMPHI
uniref:F-box/LRR-repeat protein n=1 Tax=Noccaea caerulescens TaxID=107243 RepID=A0A1J3J556_NOCCA